MAAATQWLAIAAVATACLLSSTSAADAPGASTKFIVKLSESAMTKDVHVEIPGAVKAFHSDFFNIEVFLVTDGEDVDAKCAQAMLNPDVESCTHDVSFRIEALASSSAPPTASAGFSLQGGGSTSSLGEVSDSLDDSFFSTDNNAYGVAQFALFGYPGSVGADDAWDISVGSRDVKVCVIDSGVDTAHEDLQENLWVNEAELNGVEGVDDDENGYTDDVHGWNSFGGNGDVADVSPQGHGTAIAGVLGAVAGNGKGIAGVAHKVAIVTCRYTNEGENGRASDLLACYDYCSKVGAKIWVNAYGIVRSDLDEAEAALWTTHLGERLAETGTLFVAAAGNNGVDNDVVSSQMIPASLSHDNVVSVGFTHPAADMPCGMVVSCVMSEEDHRTNYGAASVDIFAPGYYTVSTVPASVDALGARYFTGSSFAAPLVAGAAVLLLAADPYASAAEMKAMVMSLSKRSSAYEGKCVAGGRLDVGAVMSYHKWGRFVKPGSDGMAEKVVVWKREFFPPSINELPPLEELKTTRVLKVLKKQLQGTLPADWSELTNLEAIRLNGNALYGSLPEQWSLLTNLRTIRVSNCGGLSGPLPPQWSALTKLKRLRVQYNALTSTLPVQFSALAALRSIDVRANQFSGTLPAEWGPSMPDLNYARTDLNSALTRDVPESYACKATQCECEEGRLCW